MDGTIKYVQLCNFPYNKEQQLWQSSKCKQNPGYLIQSNKKLIITHRAIEKRKMPPKKLTKKQQEELKKLEAQKKEEEEAKKRELEEKKQAEKERLAKIEAERLAEEERARLQNEKAECEPILQKRIQLENSEMQKLMAQKNWNKYLEAVELPSVEGADLSTFISQYQQPTDHPNDEKLQQCQNSELIVAALKEKSMAHLAQKQQELLEEAEENIRAIRKISMKKLEEVMVNLASTADSFVEEKQLELAKKLSQNKKHDDKKQEDTVYYKMENFKMGVFYSSSSTKSSFKFKPAEIKQFGFSTEIPGKLMNSNLIAKFEWTDFDPYSSSAYTPLMVVGGVLTIEFFELLSNSKKMTNWTLKTDYDGKEILDKSRMAAGGQKELFRVTYLLPDYVYLKTIDKTNLKVGLWDGSKWSLLPTDNLQIDIQRKNLEFNIPKAGSLAYIQDRCSDYPYVSWQLRSVKPNIAHLDLVCKRQTLKFQIGQNYARLLVADKNDELARFDVMSFTPQRLLYELQRAGINLLPVDQDYEASQLKPKDSVAEERAIRDVAYALSTFYARSFKHSTGDIIVKLKENMQFDETFLEDQEKDWKKVQWTNNKCFLLDRKDRTLSHYNLDILLKENEDLLEPGTLKHFQEERSIIAKKTVIKFLRLTRILSFIQG